MTAKELAQRLGVSTRTIYRDMDTLSLAGIPVYTQKGTGGGIRLLPEFVMNKALVSEAEQNEILSALQGLGAVGAGRPDEVVQKLSAIFNKRAADWLAVDFTGWNGQDGERFNCLKSAILRRQVVEFDYYSTYGEKTRRRVEPIQLWLNHAWYVKAFCLSRQAVRLFRLSRIKKPCGYPAAVYAANAATDRGRFQAAPPKRNRAPA